ncbi:MAG TPA: PEP/pyruvate-binding domain-containing protein, partial [Chloroflexota bacterium]|nr:PEP/pyruvate-binding domain-containing protein [Chloroflexota bacterium]
MTTDVSSMFPPASTAAATSTIRIAAQTHGGAVSWLDASPEPAQLGGKAGPLARLAASGLAVPPGFVILPMAFPGAAPAGVSVGAVRAGEGGENDESGREHALLEIPTAVQEEIREAYAELGRRMGEPAPLVAVRSSATTEDLDVASFAGQYETYLGVRGAEEVVAHALRCWASLWAPHAVQYRQQAALRAGTELPAPAMAVLVQTLVLADAAGVAFTADPVTGDTGAVMLNAAWGLGQSVVDGEVETDSWRVDRQTHAVLSQTTGHKLTRSGIGPDATRVAVPEELQRQPCLTAEQVARVVELALRAEEAIGVPADVEWAIEGETLWLLQARPITTGGAGSGTGGLAGATTAPPAESVQSVGPTPTFPFIWPDETAPTLHWMRGEEGKVMRPLGEDVRRAFDMSFPNSDAIKGEERHRRLMVLNGVGYRTRVPSPFTEADRLARKSAFERPGAALHERGETYLQTVVFPEVDAGNAKLAAVDLFSIDPEALAGHLEAAFAWYERAWTLHWLWAPKDPRHHFKKLYREVTGVAEDAPADVIETADNTASELLTHEPNLLIEAIDGLMGLACIIQRHQALRELFLSRPASEVLPALAGLDGSDNAKAAGELRAALDALLERQGLRCGEGYGNHNDEMLPSWREDPSLVMALVQRYVSLDLDALLAARAAATAARDRRVAELRATITEPERVKDFDFWLEAARRAQRGFEDHNYKIDSASSGLLHIAITACARRLVSAGLLEAESDAWGLHKEEIGFALRGLGGPAKEVMAQPAVDPTDQAGETSAVRKEVDWRQLATARKALHAWRETLTAPETLGAAPPPEKPEEKEKQDEKNKAEQAQPAAPPEAVVVAGKTGSAGTATGKVYLADKNTLVPDVQPGDVLVARNAAPLWTPIFPTVAAVVLDEGA